MQTTQVDLFLHFHQDPLQHHGNGNTVVSNNDILGDIRFAGDDGTDINSIAAAIRGEVDGAPGSNDMPGRLIFATTPDGAASATERLRIDSSGRLLIGTSNARTGYSGNTSKSKLKQQNPVILFALALQCSNGIQDADTYY